MATVKKMNPQTTYRITESRKRLNLYCEDKEDKALYL